MPTKIVGQGNAEVKAYARRVHEWLLFQATWNLGGITIDEALNDRMNAFCHEVVDFLHSPGQEMEGGAGDELMERYWDDMAGIRASFGALAETFLEESRRLQDSGKQTKRRRLLPGKDIAEIYRS